MVPSPSPRTIIYRVQDSSSCPAYYNDGACASWGTPHISPWRLRKAVWKKWWEKFLAKLWNSAKVRSQTFDGERSGVGAEESCGWMKPGIQRCSIKAQLFCLSLNICSEFYDLFRWKCDKRKICSALSDEAVVFDLFVEIWIHATWNFILNLFEVDAYLENKGF